MPEIAIRCDYPYLILIEKSGRNATIINSEKGVSRKLQGNFIGLAKILYANKRVGSVNTVQINRYIKRLGYTIWGKHSSSSWIERMPSKENANGDSYPNTLQKRHISKILQKNITRLDLIQAINTPQSSFERYLHLTKFLSDKSTVCFLGDDDMLSTYLSDNYSTTVFDIDDELLGILKKSGIETVHQNFLHSFSTDHHEAYDIVHCDPPCAPNWIELFLIRSQFLVRREGRIFVTCHPSSEPIISKIACKYGLDIQSSSDFKVEYMTCTFSPLSYESKVFELQKNVACHVQNEAFDKVLETTEKSFNKV